MVDLTDLAAHHGSAASDARLKRRRRAELRLQTYGILAIALAGLALITLMSTVVGKAWLAMTETYISLDVALPEEEIDPDGTGDPAVIGKADFGGLVKDVLKEAFPFVTGRSDRRELYDLVSSGASFELRETVMADAALVGQSRAMKLLASDVADLYLKGEFGRLDVTRPEDELEVSLSDDEAEVKATGPIFAPMLSRVRDGLRQEAARLRLQAERQDRGVAVFQQRADAAESEDDRAEHLAQVEARTAERDRLLAQAEAMEARSGAETGTEELGEDVPSLLISVGGGWIKATEISDIWARGEVIVPPEDVTPRYSNGQWQLAIQPVAETARKISDRQIAWIETLKAQGKVETVFNTRFFTAGDSREPELSGVWGAAVGSFWTMLVTFALAFPVGVLAAIYLEEFAPKNRLTDFIEVNINNLAAVPSIVFGLLGLAVFLTVFGVPRSSPLAGGIVLALMTLPTIIIASRAAIRAVPPSIRDAALGLGASRLQTSFHHVLPLAMPGILTGTIIGMAQALGETAPLIMIGMVAFIVDVPQGITDSATVLPVQVFRWSDFPERAFEARTAAAICVLLVFLILMNALAVFLRKRFERRW